MIVFMRAEKNMGGPPAREAGQERGPRTSSGCAGYHDTGQPTHAASFVAWVGWPTQGLTLSADRQ